LYGPAQGRERSDMEKGKNSPTRSAKLQLSAEHKQDTRRPGISRPHIRFSPDPNGSPLLEPDFSEPWEYLVDDSEGTEEFVSHRKEGAQ
jgi:hypothetical protein